MLLLGRAGSLLGLVNEKSILRTEPEYVVRVDKSLGVLGVLLEPTTVVAKAWQQILSIGQRTSGTRS